jgi:cell wall assembly regulator SMI1
MMGAHAIWRRLEDSAGHGIELRQGATSEHVLTLEKEVSWHAGHAIELPADYKALMASNNGFEAYLWPIGYHYSVDDTLIQYKKFVRRYENRGGDLHMEIAVGPVKPVVFSPLRIPIAGENLEWFIDLDPVEGGVRGQVVCIDFEADSIFKACDGYADFLDKVTQGLRNEPAGWAAVFDSHIPL